MQLCVSARELRGCERDGGESEVPPSSVDTRVRRKGRSGRLPCKWPAIDGNTAAEVLVVVVAAAAAAAAAAARHFT